MAGGDSDEADEGTAKTGDEEEDRLETSQIRMIPSRPCL